MIRTLSLIVCFVLVACFAHAARPIIVFMTDFGTVDDSVAICKGVILKIAPDVQVIDLTHEVTPYSIQEAARFLAGTTQYYPAGTVFLAVIDPGVGSERKPLIVKSKKGQYFVLPDNGLITLVQDADGIEEAREISNPEWTVSNSSSSTFHGRDIFAPAAAYLIAGKDWTRAGPVVSNFVRLPIKNARLLDKSIEGEIIGLDGPFGNLITNIPAEMLTKFGVAKGDAVEIEVRDQKLEVPFVKTFSDVPSEHTLLYVDSRGRIAIAINQGNFAQTFRITPPAGLTIRKKIIRP